MQWKPTDINNKELTIKEISELEPCIEIVDDKDQFSCNANKSKRYGKYLKSKSSKLKLLLLK